jgi:hypothetical protein
MQLFGVPEVCHTQRTHLQQGKLYILFVEHKTRVPISDGSYIAAEKYFIFLSSVVFFKMFLTNFDGQVS